MIKISICKGKNKQWLYLWYIIDFLLTMISLISLCEDVLSFIIRITKISLNIAFFFFTWFNHDFPMSRDNEVHTMRHFWCRILYSRNVGEVIAYQPSRDNCAYCKHSFWKLVFSSHNMMHRFKIVDRNITIPIFLSYSHLLFTMIINHLP